MQRFDLRHLKGDFYGRMAEIMERKVSHDEVAIFLFEIGNFESVSKSANLIRDKGYTLMNSLKYNEVDWTIVVKKATPETPVKIDNSVTMEKKEN